MPKSVSFNVAYDARADVLYITVRREAAGKGVEDQHGIVWRYGRDGDLIGATVVDFVDIWGSRGDALAAELASHFDIPEAQALNVIEHALGDRLQ
jgi:uncharacterized protein YuzE